MKIFYWTRMEASIFCKSLQICHTIALLLIVTNLSVAQTPGIKTFNPPTPNAASLGKYGELPVSLYNGIPEISIPLYTVKARGVELPISLNYHAGGIKVEEIASWVGLGFTLDAGGVITRSIRSVPDDLDIGYFNRKNVIKENALEYLADNMNPASSFAWDTPTNGHPDNTGSSLWLSQADKMIGDSEPDVFYFNFAGKSGKFFMDENGAFVATPMQDLKIELVESTNLGATKWRITTPDGVEYIFGTSSDPEPGNVRTAMDRTVNTLFNSIYTAWYLLEVITPYKDIIKLYYIPEEYSYEVKDSETANVPLQVQEYFPLDPALAPNVKTINTKYHFGVRLNRISSSVDELNFIPANRTDLPSSSCLQRIEISNVSGTLNKKIDFSYGYFRAYDGAGRLRLDQIEEFAGTTPNKISGGKHVFEYDLQILPSLNPTSQSMNSQDLWGYYNGQTNAVLTQSLKVEMSPGQFLTLNGAKRHASEYHAQAGILRKITYPTGGFTEFHFEGNRVYASDADFQFLNSAPVSKSDYLVINSGDGVQQKDFTIVDANPLTGTVLMNMLARQMANDCPTDPNGYPICFEMYLEGINGTYFPKILLKEGRQTIPLSPGTYRMSGSAISAMETLYNKYKTSKTYYYQLNWEEFPLDTQFNVKSDKVVGGLRIKRIVNYSATGNVSIKKYEYNLFGTSTTSGVVVNFPQHYATVFRVLYDPGEIFAAFAREAIYLQVRSYPLAPMQPTKSAALGYANVTEYSGEYGENGKTEYVFKTAIDYPDVFKNYRPFPQPTSYDWRRGLLHSQTTYAYDKAANLYKTIKTVQNDYTFDKNPHVAYGFAFERQTHAHSASEGGFMIEDATNFYVGGYRLLTEFFYKHKETTRVYEPAGSSNFIETIANYEYGWAKNHYQLISKTETNSDNSVLVTTSKYPDDDLTLIPEEETARQLLQSKFMKSAILEQQQTKNGTLISKTKYRYKVTNTIPLPSGIDLQVEQNPNEQRVLIDGYDAFGNILHQKKVSDVGYAYLWGYNNIYPIAEVVNAEASEIAHTSFETNELGNWTFTPSLPTSTTGVSRTGRKFLPLASGTSLSKSGLSTSKTYIVSYWSKNGGYSVNASTPVSGPSINGWTYYEHKITNPSNGTITLTGTGSLDELRLYPKDAKMTTFTYDAAVGITSATDPNNITVVYEYDLLGRLKVIRDSNNKILKTLVYHYKGE